jgi:hypothetical protein
MSEICRLCGRRVPTRQVKVIGVLSTDFPFKVHGKLVHSVRVCPKCVAEARELVRASIQSAVEVSS